MPSGEGAQTQARFVALHARNDRHVPGRRCGRRCFGRRQRRQAGRQEEALFYFFVLSRWRKGLDREMGEGLASRAGLGGQRGVQ